MKNWTHQIIDFLRDNYSETSTELNRFVKGSFNINDNDNIKAAKIKEILDEYEKKGYLTWKVAKINIDNKYNDKDWDDGMLDIVRAGLDPKILSSYKGLKDNYGKEFEGAYITLDSHRIEARLTIEGLDYSINRPLNQSIIETNNSLRISSKAQKVATWIIAGATIVNIFVSALPFITSKSELKEQIRQLQIEQQQLKEQLEKSQNKVLPVVPLRTDTTHH